MKYLLSGCTCSLELTKFTKFINKTYEEKKNTNKTRKVIFHYKLLCLLSPEAHKTKICCFISLLFGWRDEETPALRNKKSMYISRQFLNSFDISVFTNLAWRNKLFNSKCILLLFLTINMPKALFTKSHTNCNCPLKSFCDIAANILRKKLSNLSLG